MLHYVWMFIVGIVVGLLARMVMPGHENMGLIVTGLLGIAGSFLGGWIMQLFSKPASGSMFHPAGLVMSFVGAIILLFLAHQFHLFGA